MHFLVIRAWYEFVTLLANSLEERKLGERRVNPYGLIVADNKVMEEDEAVEIEEVWEKFSLPCVHMFFFDRS